MSNAESFIILCYLELNLNSSETGIITIQTRDRCLRLFRYPKFFSGLFEINNIDIMI